MTNLRKKMLPIMIGIAAIGGIILLNSFLLHPSPVPADENYRERQLKQ